MRQGWKLALAGVMAVSLIGCSSGKGGGGGHAQNDQNDQHSAGTYENSNPVTRQEEHTHAVPLQAQPNSGKPVNGPGATEKVQNAKTTQVASAGQPTKKVDVNSASVQELAQVPGIGYNLAVAIVKNRPYKSKADLINRVPNLNQKYEASFDQYLTFGSNAKMSR